MVQWPCGADLDWVGHEVTGHVVHLITAVVLPVLVPNGVQLTHALCGLRLLIQLLGLHGVLLPAVQSEAMHLRPATQIASKLHPTVCQLLSAPEV